MSNKPRRTGVLALLAAVAIGCSSSAGTDRPAPAGTSAATSASTSTPASAPAQATFAPITLTGKGKSVSKFTIPEDAPAIAQATYKGDGNFAIVALAADGSHNDLLVNTIGSYKGTVLFDVDAGEHTVAFEVDADAPWTIVVSPVSAAKAWDPTTTLKGTGDDVVRVSPASSGLVTLALTYKGDGNFAVIAYSSGGRDLLANEVGDFTGQVALPDGSFALAVTAAGPWSAAPS